MLDFGEKGGSRLENSHCSASRGWVPDYHKGGLTGRKERIGHCLSYAVAQDTMGP